MEDLGDTLNLPATKAARKNDDDCGEHVTLLFIEGPASGQVVELERKRMVAGRLPVSDIVLKSQSVSKAHAAFSFDGSAYVVEDLGSTNGILVNGTRLAAKGQRRLFHGDNIQLGENVAMFRQTGCFRDTVTGANRIKIDRSAAKREADEIMKQHGFA